MKVLPAVTLSFIALLIAACGTTKSKRIEQNQAQFNTYTAAEKRMIRTGQVAVGFDQDMVRMALGEPSNRKTSDTAGGTQTVWEYREIKPSVGVNLGGIIRSTGKNGVGLGSGVNVNPDRTKLLKRIVFDRQTGEVSRIETFD